jgi:hypothetical protein
MIVAIVSLRMGGPESTANQIAALNSRPGEESPHLEILKLLEPEEALANETDALRILGENGLLRPTYDHMLQFERQYRDAGVPSTKKPVIFFHGHYGDEEQCGVAVFYQEPGALGFRGSDPITMLKGAEEYLLAGIVPTLRYGRLCPALRCGAFFHPTAPLTIVLNIY